MLNFATVPKSHIKSQTKSKAKAKPKPLRTQIYKVARWLHVYMSTAILLLILFFSLTGFLLNHPDWVFGSEPVVQDITGTLPVGWQQDGQVDWLNIAEYMRTEHNVHGQVANYWNDDVEGQLNFTSAGYLADVYFDMQTGAYTLYTESQGMVAFMTDLHKGSNTGPIWNWVIDATALLLAVVSLSGLVLTLLLKKLRVKGLITMLGGTAVIILLIVLAV